MVKSRTGAVVKKISFVDQYFATTGPPQSNLYASPNMAVWVRSSSSVPTDRVSPGGVPHETWLVGLSETNPPGQVRTSTLLNFP